MHQREQAQGYLAAIGTVVIWSGFIVVSRLGGKSVLTYGHALAAPAIAGVGALL